MIRELNQKELSTVSGGIRTRPTEPTRPPAIPELGPRGPFDIPPIF